jgi:hypothetical protein
MSLPPPKVHARVAAHARPRSWYVDVDEIALDEIAFLKTEIYLRDFEPRLQTLTAFTRFGTDSSILAAGALMTRPTVLRPKACSPVEPWRMGPAGRSPKCTSLKSDESAAGSWISFFHQV